MTSFEDLVLQNTITGKACVLTEPGTSSTHAAEAGAHTGTLLAFSGHASVTSLARDTRVSPAGKPDETPADSDDPFLPPEGWRQRSSGSARSKGPPRHR